MMRKIDSSEFLFELILIAIGKKASLSFIPTAEDWFIVYEEAMKQSLLGIFFAAVSKLPKSERPCSELFYQWLSDALQIQYQNEHLDKQTAEMWKQLKEAGLEAAVLKGQGVATLYDIAFKTADGNSESLATLRQGGDIDIWIRGGYQKVCDFVQSTNPTDDLAYHRFHYNAYEDTEVELHHRPTLMRNLFDDRKLEKWYNSFGADSFILIENKGFAVPPYEFNVIFILSHIYRHFLFEGVGLRQVMDYYFVLKNRPIETVKKEKIKETLRTLSMIKFAGALMWVLKSQFEIEETYLICEPIEYEGRFLLNEILLSGNFGQLDGRYQYKKLFKLKRFISRGSHLLIHYPSEVIWSPIWMFYHWLWKIKKKKEIHHR